MSQYLDYDPDDIDVRIAELLTATHDSADPLLHPKVQEVLGLLRRKLGMDVVFVSEFSRGRRVFRAVDSAPGESGIEPGGSDPLEESWCHHVVNGRVPQLVRDAAPLVAAGRLPDPGFTIGTHLSTPVMLGNGTAYGTLCCFSHSVKGEVSSLDLRRLQMTARLLSEELQAAGLGTDSDTAPT